LQEIRDRDARDSQRAAAPLQKGADAVELDTTGLSIEESVARVLALYRSK
jgi:cytidylate kinase